MHWLEARFRAKFERRGDIYVFRQWDRDVAFSGAEVEQMVEQWRIYWQTPFFWIGWLVLGVIAPLLLWRSDFWGGQGFAAVSAVTANVAMAVLLVHGERIPNAEAETRVTVGPNLRAPPKPTSAAWNLFWIGAALLWLFAVPHTDHANSLLWIWWLIIAFHGWALVQRIQAWYRLRRAG